jgi:hypothetical protein
VKILANRAGNAFLSFNINALTVCLRVGMVLDLPWGIEANQRQKP